MVDANCVENSFVPVTLNPVKQVVDVSSRGAFIPNIETESYMLPSRSHLACFSLLNSMMDLVSRRTCCES